MSQIKIKDFLNKYINLEKNKYENVVSKYKNSKEFLEKNGFKKIRRQGSMATKTSIKPRNPSQEYDLDIAIIVEDNFLENKNKLEKILKEKFENVTRKSKCINVVWSNNFNGDFTIIKNIKKNNKNYQSIYDEEKNIEIDSNNIELLKILNDTFNLSENDSLRDCSKLIKFYLRQHKDTNDLIPSIVQNLLILSNYAQKSLGYEGQIVTTISNIIFYLNKMLNNNKLLCQFLNSTNNTYIDTKIKNLNDMKNIILVLQDLKIDIEKDQLRALNIDSKIRSSEVDFDLTQKPWKK